MLSDPSSEGGGASKGTDTSSFAFLRNLDQNPFPWRPLLSRFSFLGKSFVFDVEDVRDDVGVAPTPGAEAFSPDLLIEVCGVDFNEVCEVGVACFM